MTLHLVLKRQWYDMIAIGEKREEYREFKPYWKKRLFSRKYQYVCFHRAYTNTTMAYQIEKMSVGYGKQNWGAPKDKVYVIAFSQLNKI